MQNYHNQVNSSILAPGYRNKVEQQQQNNIHNPSAGQHSAQVASPSIQMVAMNPQIRAHENASQAQPFNNNGFGENQ